MKNLILATSALALTAGMALADGHGKTVRMGTEGAYPPYNFLNDAGEVDGFEREVGDELCKRAELTWRRADLRVGHKRVGQHYPKPRLRQLRRNHRRDVHHGRA